MEQVARAGLLQAGTRVELLSNRLVVVVPAEPAVALAFVGMSMVTLVLSRRAERGLAASLAGA